MPTKLTVGWQGCGGSAVPPHHRAGPQYSRTTALAASTFASVDEASELRGGMSYAASGWYDPDIISPDTLIVDLPSEIRKLTRHNLSTYARRVAALVDASATLLHAWSRSLPPDQRLAQLTLSAHAFVPQPRQSLFARCTPAALRSIGASTEADEAAAAATPAMTGAGATESDTREEGASAAARVASESESESSSLRPQYGPGAWACRMCTFLNRALARRCEMCEEWRPAQAGAGAGASSPRQEHQARSSQNMKRSVATEPNGIERYLRRRL